MRNIGACRRIGVCRPDVFKRSAAAVGDPKAPVLGIPVALGLATRRVGRVGPGDAAMAADEFYVVQIGMFAGLPFAGDGAGVTGAGREADAAEDIGAAYRSLHHGLGSAEAAKGRGI